MAESEVTSSVISIGDASIQNFSLFFIVIILTFIVAGILNTLVVRLLKERTEPAVYKTISKLVMYGVYAFGLYFAFVKVLELNVPASLAALGILGVAMLLPTIPFLQNVAAGIVIAFERPFREDDIVEVNGNICRVKDIMLKKTVLRALDGKLIIVPNISFITGDIINYSRGEFIRVALNMDIASTSDKEKAISIIEKICSEHPNILPNIPPKRITRITKLFEIPKNFFKIPKNIKDLTPKVMIKGVNKEKISLEVWFWIWNIILKEKTTSSFYEKIIEEFKKEKIEFG